MSRGVRALRGAVSFLTRLPVAGEHPRDDEWSSALALFPLVGLLVGVLEGLAFAVFLRAGSLVAATAATIAGILVTGALHQDGLADTADALGGGHDAERIRAIAKDPRVGSFGVVAIASLLLFRVTLLASVEAHAVTALLVTCTIARLAPLFVMAKLPYAGDPEARKSAMLPTPTDGSVLVATATALFVLGVAVVLGAVSLAGALAVVIAVLVVTAVAAWRFHVRIGGFLGDFLGAIEQLAEVAALAALALV